MRDVSLAAPKVRDFPEERAAPRRRAAAASARARGPEKRRSVLARVFGPQRMGVLFVLGIGGLAFVGVPMNALFFQDGRHPAPLFAGRPPAGEKSAQAAAPVPPARPAQIEAARVEPEAAKPEPSRVRSVEKADVAALQAESARTEAVAAKPAKAEKAEKKRDPIGQLLGAGETAPAKGPDARVLGAQRALQKLGYVVRPDGIFGAGTRQAIERFERDSGLPAKGELSPGIAKLLAARAGLSRP